MKKAFCATLCAAALLLSGCSALMPLPSPVPSASPDESTYPGITQSPGPLPSMSPPAESIPPYATTPTPSVAPQTPVTPTADPAASTRMTYEELVADDGTREEFEDWPPVGTYTVKVDLTNCVMSAYDASGTLVRQALCTIGTEDSSTPEGTFEMGEDRRRFGYFEEHDCYAQYWSQIDGEIFFHSLLYENDGKTLRQSSYDNLGHSGSHGCVRLSVPDAKWIYENVAPGSTVTIYSGERDDALVSALSLPKAP